MWRRVVIESVESGGRVKAGRLRQGVVECGCLPWASDPVMSLLSSLYMYVCVRESVLVCVCVCVYDKLNFDLSIILYLGVFISYQYIFHAKCLTSLDDDESCS